MSLVSQFLGGPVTAGSSGKSLKYQEFLSSGTFTPSQALIGAGGIIHVFIVGGGGRGNADPLPGAGGQVSSRFLTLTSTASIAVTIGAGGEDNSTYDTVAGGASSFGSLLSVNGGNNGTPLAPYNGEGVLGYGARVQT